MTVGLRLLDALGSRLGHCGCDAVEMQYQDGGPDGDIRRRRRRVARAGVRCRARSGQARFARRWRLRDPYFWPKARTRLAWSTWADDVFNLAVERAHVAQWMRENAGQGGVVILPVHDPAFAAVTDDQERPDAGGAEVNEAIRRRALAQELHAQMTEPALWTGPDRLALSVLNVPAAHVPGAAHAIREAPLTAQRHPLSVLVSKGKRSGAVVLRLHGDTFSVVMSADPNGPVLLVLDELPDYAIRIDTDPDAKAVMRAWTMWSGILAAVDKNAGANATISR